MPACSHANMPARASEAGRDLVGDEERAVRGARARAARADRPADAIHMPAAPCTSGSTITAARLAPCSASVALGLGERGARAPPPGPCRAASGRRAAASGGPRAATRGRDEAVEGLRVADADRAERVAVVRLDQRREARAPVRRRAAAGTGARCGARPRPRSRRRRSRRRASARAGRSATSACASSIDGTLPSPSSVVCATRSSWARSAASRRGWRWPCTLHQSDDTPSR